MDTFPSGFVESTWHQHPGYPTFPSPPDTHFGFHGLDSSNTLIDGPNDIIQLNPWFCQRWLDKSGDVQTEAPVNLVRGQGSSATTQSEYGTQTQAQSSQEYYSDARSKIQQHKGPHSQKTTTSTQQGYSCNGGQNQDSMQGKASRIRERNRNIARKYRDRKLHEAEALEAHRERLQEENAVLRDRCNDLKQEVLDLKNLLLQHTECNCTMIQAFIATEAKRSLHSLLSSSSLS
ncbi:hypothetical protein FBULB1_11834 [Fusarium bulbicola]|nr:hypothetical protein FBULB1_11834 [Fusarium bulbicola]